MALGSTPSIAANNLRMLISRNHQTQKKPQRELRLKNVLLFVVNNNKKHCNANIITFA